MRLPLLCLGALEVALLSGVAIAVVYLMPFFQPEAAMEGVGTLRPGSAFDAVTFGLLAVASATAMGWYRPAWLDSPFVLALRGSVALFLLTFAAVVFLKLATGKPELSWTTIGASSVVGLPTVLAVHLLVSHLIRAARFQHRIVLVGSPELAYDINKRLHGTLEHGKIRLVGFVPASGGGDAATGGRSSLVSIGSNTLLSYCQRHRIDEIVVASGPGAELDRLLQDGLLDCKLSGIRTTDFLDFLEREAGCLDVDFLRPGWLLFVDGFRSGMVRRAVKRVFDVVVSLALVALTWPLILLAALAIKLEEGRHAPVFYRQQRVGLNGAPYSLLKIRSMRSDAERGGGARWAQIADPRITRVGRWIRPTRIDELPQLLHVLDGTMSFVGPRPERPEFVDDLKSRIPFYDARHRVKPGLTGWAQINYPYASSVEDAKGKLEYDLYYVKNHSIGLDLLTLVRTVETVLLGVGAR